MQTETAHTEALFRKHAPGSRRSRRRPLIAYFASPDVFEDFYPHYGVDQHAFVTRWADTGAHDLLSVLQRAVGDVTWYELSVAPELSEGKHEVVGCRVKILRSSWVHRRLWRAFYLPRIAWRWRGAYRAFATAASYLAPISAPFLKAVWRDRPDAFYVQGYATGRFDVLVLLARALGVPVVAYHAGGTPDGYLGGSIRRWTIPRADYLVVSGRDEREMLADRYGVPRERIAVILTPIDTQAYRPIDRAAACESAGLDPARRHLLFVGRLQDSVKRVSALIRVFAAAAAAHGDADLLVAGTGSDDEALRRLATKLAPGRVRFLGWRSGANELAPLYNAAECLILPSRREGFPSVVGEALACGTPVAASSVGGVGELVADGENGLLIPAGDDRALADAVRFVLDRPDAVASMRPEARRSAEERLSPDAIGAQLQRCFSRVLSDGGAIQGRQQVV
jgi:glycosyltransferase involved in cell wall biosynthesis